MLKRFVKYLALKFLSTEEISSLADQAFATARQWTPEQFNKICRMAAEDLQSKAAVLKTLPIERSSS